MKIADYMVTNLIWVDAGSSLEEAAILFSENSISSLLVKENGEYVGIISKTDIIERVIAKGLNPITTLTGSVMSKPLLTMDHYLPRKDAHEFMSRKKIKHLVVTEHGKVVGILTLKDMIS